MFTYTPIAVDILQLYQHIPQRLRTHAVAMNIFQLYPNITLWLKTQWLWIFSSYVHIFYRPNGRAFSPVISTYSAGAIDPVGEHILQLHPDFSTSWVPILIAGSSLQEMGRGKSCKHPGRRGLVSTLQWWFIDIITLPHGHSSTSKETIHGTSFFRPRKNCVRGYFDAWIFFVVFLYSLLQVLSFYERDWNRRDCNVRELEYEAL